MFNKDYPFECACGENFRMIHHAVHCRKCRTYTYAGHCTHVTDLTTDKVVWGRTPTEEEEAAAEERYRIRIAVEEADFANWMAEQEAERARLIVAQNQMLADARMDALYDIQDSF